MRYSKIKGNDLIDLKVDRIEYELIDDAIKEIRLISSDSVIKITHDYSQLLVYEKTKPKYKDLYVMRAVDKFGANVSKEFEEEADAVEFLQSARPNYTAASIEKITTTVDE